MPALLAITDRAYLQTPLRKWCNGQVQNAHINETTGYLRILSFSGYSKERGFANGLTALQTALDEIFSDPTLKALAIDFRINFGCDDRYGLEIASRLATADYLAYTKVARGDPVDRNKWTPEDSSMVHPSTRPGFAARWWKSFQFLRTGDHPENGDWQCDFGRVTGNSDITRSGKSCRPL